jgi:hypothetical protein
MEVNFFKDPYVLFAIDANTSYKLIGFARDNSNHPGNHAFMNPVVILC